MNYTEFSLKKSEIFYGGAHLTSGVPASLQGMKYTLI